MEVIIKKISDIKTNPNNPRLIRDDKFKKLVKSIKDFPEMLNIRPVVVNSDMVVLGGNMRLKACKEAGLKEIPVIISDNLSDDQQKEFIIKDNISGGEWDFDLLSNEWEAEQLDGWGLDIPIINDEKKITKENLAPFKKTHVLLSFAPEKMIEIQSYLEKIIDLPGIEYEQSSN